jgi:RNase P/RNase MRP subunit POP5
MVRYKNRYLVMRAEFKDGKRVSAAATTTPNPSPSESADLSPALTAACRDAVGAALGPAALAAALPALSTRFHAPTSGVCVIRCARDGHDRLAAALCRRVTLVALRSASLSLLSVQGAPRTARAAALSHHWRLLAATALVEKRGEEGSVTPMGEGNPAEEARRVAQAQLRQRKRRRQDEALASAAAADALRLAAAEL